MIKKKKRKVKKIEKPFISPFKNKFVILKGNKGSGRSKTVIDLYHNLSSDMLSNNAVVKRIFILEEKPNNFIDIVETTTNVR